MSTNITIKELSFLFMKEVYKLTRTKTGAYQPVFEVGNLIGINDNMKSKRIYDLLRDKGYLKEVSSRMDGDALFSITAQGEMFVEEKQDTSISFNKNVTPVIDNSFHLHGNNSGQIVSNSHDVSQSAKNMLPGSVNATKDIKLKLPLPKISINGVRGSLTQINAYFLYVAFNIENIGIEIINHFTLELQIPSSLKSLTFDSKIKPFFQYYDNGYTIFSIDNSKPLYPKGLATVLHESFTIDKFSVKDAVNNPIKLKLFYSSVPEELSFFILNGLTYKGKEIDLSYI